MYGDASSASAVYLVEGAGSVARAESRAGAAVREGAQGSAEQNARGESLKGPSGQSGDPG